MPPNWVFRADWQIPGGEFHLALDPLSAVFLFPILALSVLAFIYSIGYLKKKDQWTKAQTFFFYIVLVISMCVVVCARNAILFLMAWEVMALSSFFLVMTDAARPEVRHAGWMYFLSTHIGAAFIVILFSWMGHVAGSFDFDEWGTLLGRSAQPCAAWFLLALIGFGTKAGFWPVHVWLPEAHPAAPSHVSAVMSGVMIKTGIYGLIRILTFLGPPPAWWGMTILFVGAISGILGVLFALAQHDIKRFLAYHSVENIGIIALGIGGGMLGMSWGMKDVAVLGFAGAFLHVINHALFKGLLFLNAGSVALATGTRNIETMGGLLKKMPVTGTTFMIGSASICGLPPFNGFVSEFLIYVCFFKIALSGPLGGVLGSTAIAALAMMGGMAAACFVKVFGVVFLGEPRSALAARESPASMLGPMMILAMGCIFIGVLPFVAFQSVSAAALQMAEVSAASVEGAILPMITILKWISAAAGALIGLVFCFFLLGKILLSGRSVSETVTWDCGYSKPAPRMQYTAGSFVQPFTDLFRSILRSDEQRFGPKGYFPKCAGFESHTPDLATHWIFRPMFGWIQDLAVKFQWFQQGCVQIYLLYIFAILIILLAVQVRA